jgi:hypothetical protein
VDVRIPRTRGAVSGLILTVLGIWGTLIPLIGPSFNLAVGPDKTFDFTTGRLLLEIAPGVATIIGGLILLTTANRASAVFAAWLAMAGGVWFAIGPVMSMLWNHGVMQTGTPIGTGTGHRVLDWLLLFYGLGAAIIAFSGIAAGRLSVRTARDIQYAEAAAAERGAAAPARGTGRFGRDRDRDGVPDREEERTRMAPVGNGHGNIDDAATSTSSTRRID